LPIFFAISAINLGFKSARTLSTMFEISLEAFAADGSSLGHAVTGADDESMVLAPSNIRETAQILRAALARDRSLTVLVHRPGEVAKNVGGNPQRELRQALGALEEDPTQLDTLLKLTEKVSFDSEDIINSEPQIRRQTHSTAGEPAKSGPDVVDIAGFKQSVLGGLAVPEEGHVRHEVVALCELVEMLDVATLARVRQCKKASFLPKL
jgi:hypothetical protein